MLVEDCDHRACDVAVGVGEPAAFLGVLAACGWAFGLRLIGAADFVTLPVIVVIAAAAGAGLVSAHDDMPGSLTRIPWAALGTVLAGSVLTLVRAEVQHRAGLAIGRDRAQYIRQRRTELGRPARTDIAALPKVDGAPEVT